MSIYSGPSYQMGNAMGAAQIGGQLGADSNIITGAEKVRAEAEIKKMRSALAKWLKYRTLIGTPVLDVTPIEIRLGRRLHVLLREMFDASQLPSENSPMQLAQIAIAGKLPTEMQVAAPSAVGFIWLWPAVAIVGLVLMTVVAKIKSDAEDAADERRTQCIQAGKCTDTGFWIKAAVVAGAAWFAWEKMGLKKMATK